MLIHLKNGHNSTGPFHWTIFRRPCQAAKVVRVWRSGRQSASRGRAHPAEETCPFGPQTAGEAAPGERAGGGGGAGQPLPCAGKAEPSPRCGRGFTVNVHSLPLSLKISEI